MLFTLSAILLLSCKREVVDVPEFNVTTDALTYHAGDTVRFNFSGDPHHIVFWSGKNGRKYENRDRVLIEGNKLLIKFNTWQSFGVLANNFSVYASDDFSGIYDTTNIKNATWKDLTGRVVLSTGVDQTQSGSVDLTGPGLFDGSKVIYVAFRYRTGNINSPNRWVVRTFNADVQDENGVLTAAAVMSTAGWKAVSFKLPAVTWSVTTAQLLLAGVKGIEYDEWVVSKSFNPKATTPDKGLAIKNTSFNLSQYGEEYKEPGTYKVTFIATNASYQNAEKVIKELTITVLP